MDNRERMRLYMAHQRQVRRKLGLCPRCGLIKVPPGTNCPDCNEARAIKRVVVSPLAEMPSTRAS